MDEPCEIKGWKKVSDLGSGAFGVVSLWKNKLSEEFIAIKKCKFKTSHSLTNRQKQRWENEVEIMKSLKCLNIISFKPLPKDLEDIFLKHNPTKLPILSMEYCNKGNLRYVLTNPNNLSGLEENDVKIVLQDITTAVSYLHKLKITHRDIKPENIVLQQCDTRPSGAIYKLIDLGYAKELKDTVVSFVGTLHYLAPEIIKSQRYDQTVDYWSLGVLTFEILCGVIPFLPQFTPFERFSYIEKKKSDQICIYQLHSGAVHYSSELLKENHVSSCFKENIEMWLRHVLQFDPTLRSRNFPDNTNVFENLLNILKKKIVIVFCMATLEHYSYEISSSTLITTLKDWIARDTKVGVSDQILLTSNLEISYLDDFSYVIDILPNKDNCYLFVFKNGTFINRDSFNLPKSVKILFDNCTKAYKWRDLRVLYTKTLFFLTQENKLVQAVITAFDFYTKYSKNLVEKLKKFYRIIYKDITKLLLKMECYANIYTNECHLNQIKSTKYIDYLENYEQMMATLDWCILNNNKLQKKVKTSIKRQKLLDSLLPKIIPIVIQCDSINELILEATDLFLKNANFGQTNSDLACKEMVKIVSNVIKQKDKLLNNKQFRNYAKATSVAIKDVQTQLTWMTSFHPFLTQLIRDFDENQKRKYQILLSPATAKQTNLQNGHFGTTLFDTDSLIKENQELRYQFEDTLSRMFMDHKTLCDELGRL